MAPPASAASFQLSYDQLGFPVDVVRRAGRMLPSSPVYASRAGSPGGPLPSRGRPGRRCVGRERWATRPSSFVARDDLQRRPRTIDLGLEQRHGRDHAHEDRGLHPQQPGRPRPGPGAHRARALHLGPAASTKLWARNERSLSEWIMSERLEGARRSLAVHACTIGDHRRHLPPVGVHRLDAFQPPLPRGLRAVTPGMAPAQTRASSPGTPAPSTRVSTAPGRGPGGIGSLA